MQVPDEGGDLHREGGVAERDGIHRQAGEVVDYGDEGEEVLLGGDVECIVLGGEVQRDGVVCGQLEGGEEGVGG